MVEALPCQYKAILSTYVPLRDGLCQCSQLYSTLARIITWGSCVGHKQNYNAPVSTVTGEWCPPPQRACQQLQKHVHEHMEMIRTLPASPDLHMWPRTAVFLAHPCTQGDSSRCWAGWDHSAVLSLFAACHTP